MNFNFFEPSPFHQAVALWTAAGATWLLLIALSWWTRSRSRRQWSGFKLFAIWLGASVASVPVFLLLLSVLANVGRPPETNRTFIEATWWAQALVLSGPVVGAILGFLQRPRRDQNVAK